ncbi:5-oxoprolinase subunit PxpB [Metabacillus sp. JX24]|uniref:5-oxoprolinase subunit PxpB n=1 Tax=Metabacillus sp. JX24 TaxID=3240759 RepID=UPI0035100CEA
MDYTVNHMGDSMVVIEFGKTIDQKVHEHVQQVFSFFEKQSPDWMIECIPAFTTVAILYDPVKVYSHTKKALPHETVTDYIKDTLRNISTLQPAEGRKVEIPVCYGGEFGPDLAFVAEHNSLTQDEVIRIHSGTEYLVYMIGFAPGFPYIGGMSEKIAAPRKNTPRTKIPAGSVGIAGNQTGIYPIETPGGWQLIGQTPLPLFQPESESPSLLKAGDMITFKPITAEQFKDEKEKRP